MSQLLNFMMLRKQAKKSGCNVNQLHLKRTEINDEWEGHRVVGDMNVFDLFHQSDPSSVPQLAWQFVPVQRTVNPVLAFSKGDTVHFLSVSAQMFHSERANTHRSISAESDMMNLLVADVTAELSCPQPVLWFTFLGQKRGNGDHPYHQTKTAPYQLWHHQPLCEWCHTVCALGGLITHTCVCFCLAKVKLCPLSHSLPEINNDNVGVL